MKLYLLALLSVTTLSTQAAVITFDPPPLIGGGRQESSYLENNILFTGTFSHYSSEVSGSASNDSSGLLKVLFNGSMRIETYDSSLFKLNSIDLAEYSDVFIQPTTVTFTGYYTNGGSTTQTFVTDGIFDSIGGVDDFETFYFSSAFSNLDYVTVDTVIFAMDNLSVQAVPLPAAAWLFGAGLIGLAGAIRRKNLSLLNNKQQ